jgi:cellulose synthase/poly-beta-1,6-N-acetylglucosamine synthase-like glycosyltransferase
MLWILLIPVLPYFLILLFFWKHLPCINELKPVSNFNTKISVVVACRNEEKTLPLLLDSLSLQQYPADLFEVIIVDDNSTDNTMEIISSTRGIRKLKAIKNEGTGKKTAIRTGIMASDGELILTTDADCSMGREWIASAVSLFEEKKADMIIGPVILAGKPGFFQGFQQLEFLSLQGITAGSAGAGRPVMCNGANLAFTKAAYLKHAGKLHYDIASGDDVFLLHSLKEVNDTPIIWNDLKDAVVTTLPSVSLMSFLRQRARWISKAGAYRDLSAQTVAIATFITVTELFVLPFSGIYDPSLFAVYGAVIFLKSIPDYLILRKTSLLHNRQSLLRWFIPAQLIYPFYVMAVLLVAVTGGGTWKPDISYPSPRGT